MAEKAQVLPPARIRKLRIQLYAKGRSDIAPDHDQFAVFLSSRLGELASKWDIAGDPPGDSSPPEQDIFLVQACANWKYTNEGGGSVDDALNLKSHILPALNDWPEGGDENRTTALFMCMRDPGERLIACELLDGAPAIKQSSGIPSGVSSYWDALAETAWTGIGVTALMQKVVTAFNRRPAETRDDDRLERIQAILAGLNGASTPFWRTAQVKAIVEQRRRLGEPLGVLQRYFEEANGWMSLGHGQKLSVAEALHFVQLLANLFSILEDTIAVLQDLAPLHENYYTAEKRTVSTSAAVLGGATAVAVALLLWNPAGWTAARLLGAAAKAVAARGTASAIATTSGTIVAARCRNQARECKDQHKLMTEIRTNYENLKEAKRQLLTGLLVCLLGEPLQSVPLTRGDKHNLYRKMGIQCDLLNQNGYPDALVTTAWEDYSRWHDALIQNLQEMTRVIE